MAGGTLLKVDFEERKKECGGCRRMLSFSDFYKNKRDKRLGLSAWCKKCMDDKGRAWKRNNRARANAAWRAWRLQNLEHHKEVQRKWAEKNLEKYREHQRINGRLHGAERWQRRKNDPKHKERYLAWKLKNKDYLNQYMREWYARNRDRIAEKIRIKSRNRVAKLAGSVGQHTPQDISELLVVQKYKCVYCERSIQDKRHVDHITPLSLGGGNGRDNIQLLCPTCNLSKGAFTHNEFLAYREKRNAL